MVTNVELRAFWNDRGRLLRWSIEMCERLGVSSANAETMSSVGFPVEIDWGYTFIEPGKSAALSTENSLFLGRDHDVAMVLDLRRQVVLALDGDATEGRFVNSSVKQLLSSLMVYAVYRDNVLNMSEIAAQSLIDKLLMELEDCDECAMGSPTAYWPLIIDQMRQGLL